MNNENRAPLGVVEKGQLAVQGWTRVHDVLIGDGQFKYFGQVPLGIEAVFVQNDGKFHPSEKENLFEHRSVYFVYDPTRVQVVEIKGESLVGIKDEVEGLKNQGFKVCHGHHYVNSQPDGLYKRMETCIGYKIIQNAQQN